MDANAQPEAETQASLHPVLTNKNVAIVVDNYFEQAEFTEPLQTLQDAGARVDVISPTGGEVQGMHHTDKGDTFPTDKSLDEVNFDDYQALVLPGGAVNADSLRMVPEVQQAVRDFLSSGRVVAAICHAPWVLASAGIASGRNLTSFETIQDDMRNAGANWSDQEVVIDDNLITSRKPDDIPAFNQAIITALSSEKRGGGTV
jgi:protease I